MGLAEVITLLMDFLQQLPEFGVTASQQSIKK